MTSELKKVSLVLVTGASGYVASHIVRLLLQKGYKVRGTVRSLTDEQKVKPLNDLYQNSRFPLQLVEVNLLNKDGWDDALKSCEFVIHVASPFPSKPPSQEEEVLKPAVDGTLLVLKACARAGSVRRVVLTSSVAAVHGETTVKEEQVYGPQNWTDEDSPFTDAYAKSKTLAEKTAWDFVRGLPEEQRFELVSINPGIVLGPMLTNVVGTSVFPIRKMMSMTMPLVPAVNFYLCDVRDVALAHWKAITVPEAAGKRFIIGSASIWFKEMSLILFEEFVKQGYWVFRRHCPYWLVWLTSFIDSSALLILPRIENVYKYDNSLMINLLKITPRNFKQTIIDTAYSLIERGLLPKRKWYTGPKERDSW
ncbi:anthocyanidin reductase ((2S)-flavan-3-ol-forming)-like [Limulus polyphemus]|uniref:Anthocyanidin reductase ((2S)-flavan-3-ol-forming)-like n=1 Tax=Limulus polyphemus TaxID=6850 RepID=A0ABM1BWK8_LIMPO|nr:anthocyanidin reductase ((2S)-flavan-3-ol-forming)-like [Limulus polyphemus]